MLAAVPPAVRRAVAVALGAALPATGVLAQAPPDYDFQWRAIGAPGNRPTNSTENPFPPDPSMAAIGSVSYEYRMSRTEVTVSQWHEFVTAYRPYWSGSPSAPALTGDWIRWNGTQYTILPGAQNYPANMSWRAAAAFCNWLCNGKGTTAAAFSSGAYDLSTFTQNPDGSLNDQAAHTPGAQFWIPTVDEWTKAVYYDPNRYGPGQEGYWRGLYFSNGAPVAGPPGSGGQTSRGLPGVWAVDVGLYPNAQTPWGLLDASGGVPEYTEALVSQSLSKARWVWGSGTSTLTSPAADLIDFPHVAFPQLSTGFGLRLASTVPAPSGLVLVAAAAHSVCTRRRRKPRQFGAR